MSILFFALFALADRFLRSHLMADPKSRKVVVVENPLLSTRVKDMVARVLFDNLQVRRSRPSRCFGSLTIL